MHPKWLLHIILILSTATSGSKKTSHTRQNVQFLKPVNKAPTKSISASNYKECSKCVKQKKYFMHRLE